MNWRDRRETARSGRSLEPDRAKCGSPKPEFSRIKSALSAVYFAITADEIFRDLWQRANNLSSLDILTPDLMGVWATEKGLTVVSVAECGVGAFVGTPGIVLTTADAKAFFPKIPSNGDHGVRSQPAGHLPAGLRSLSCLL